MLELQGELVFKTVAYHRAADAIGRSPVDVVSAYRAGTPPQIPGVGKAISDKLAELATTGHMALLRQAERRCRRAWSSLLRSWGSDPRPSGSSTPRAVSRRSTISSRPPRAGGSAAARHVGRTEALVLEGIAKLDERSTGCS